MLDEVVIFLLVGPKVISSCNHKLTTHLSLYWWLGPNVVVPLAATATFSEVRFPRPNWKATPNTFCLFLPHGEMSYFSQICLQHDLFGASHNVIKSFLFALLN